jgi:hypothetical protein
MMKEVIVVPLEKTGPAHLEFEVREEADGTFTVVDHTTGDMVPEIKYTGFPTRRDAERFVLAQPECWE